jgi:hypothetical protein
VPDIEDIEAPETEPEYVIDREPTVPKRMEVPCTVPWMLVGTLLNPDTLIVPVRSFPDWSHFRLNVPLKLPL